jgi:hypothetical protein
MTIPIKDYHYKPLKKFYRPYFSPRTNSYECDYATTGKIYNFNGTQFRWWFVCININTKFLYMLPLEVNENLSMEKTFLCLSAIQETLAPHAKIKSIRADGGSEFGFLMKGKQEKIPRPGEKLHQHVLIGNSYVSRSDRSINFVNFLQNEKINLFTTGSPYINKNRVIDRAIRTIRDMLGEDYRVFFNLKAVITAVDFYNNTPHKAFNYEYTPTEVQANIALEEHYIRQHLHELEEIRDRQQKAGFFSYVKGDILLIHLDIKKMTLAYKVRRRFNRLARFVRYVNGNVECSVLERNGDNDISWSDTDTVIIPIYYTKFLVDEDTDIPEPYLRLVI